MKLLLALVLLSFVTACYHPLEITGQGNIVSSDGLHDCSVLEQPCENLITGDYNVTYSAVPHAGWTFVGWEGCGAQHPDCTFTVPAATVAKYPNVRVPLRAVFEPITAQPNILLILGDDMAFDQYGFAGHPALQTPSLDTLAAESVRYSQSYTSSACRPTEATLFSGLPEHVHGVTYTVGPFLGDYLTVIERLGNSGYSSYHAGTTFEGNPMSHGFTDRYPPNSYVGNTDVGRTASMQPIYEFMAQSTSPWFVWFAPNMPHSPHNAPSEYTDLYQGLGLDAATIEYFGMVSWFDSVVGDLLLEAGPNTVVIYLSDNGYVQSAVSQVPTADSKNTSYEHGIRTQLLMRHPTIAAVERLELTSAVDVAATILSLATAFHDDLPGRALLGPPPSSSSAYGSRSTLGYLEPSGTLLERWIRVGDWKYVDVEVGGDRLYDLALDPNEAVNEVDVPEYSQLLLDLQNELETWWLQ